MTPPDTDDDLDLPPSIALAWGLREAGSRGPRRALTLEQIAEAGIRVAVSEGVGALSMGRIAQELGVGTMSLYRYVAAKDELLLIMVDTALGAPPPAGPGEDWRAGLTRWAAGLRAGYLVTPGERHASDAFAVAGCRGRLLRGVLAGELRSAA